MSTLSTFEINKEIDIILDKIVEKRKELNILDKQLHTLIVKKYEKREFSSILIDTRV